MGSSLLMCKCTTLSTCNGSLKNRYPMPGGSATGSGHKRTGIPPGSCHTWKHKGQPCRLLFLPLDGERSGRTQVLGGVAAAPGRTECHPPPPPVEERQGLGGTGGGEGGAYHLVLYHCFVCPSWFPLPCYYPLLQDTVFVVETLFFLPITLEKGI